MSAPRREAGFTVLELLVAAAVLSLLMGIVTAFMSMQTRTSAIQKARNEAIESARIALSLLSWDIQNAGYRVTVTDSPAEKLGIRATDSGSLDSLIIRFLDESLTPASAQRVSYSLGDEPRSLRRVQYADGSSAPADQPTVASVVALNLTYVTRSDHFLSPDDSGACPTGTSPVPPTGTAENCLVPWEEADVAQRLVRSVEVEVLARSTTQVPGYADSSGTYTFADGSSYSAQPGYVYHYASQTVLAPNLGR